MKEKIKFEIWPCEICGYPVVNYESGVCMRTFEDFIHGLDFYSEMAFTYKGEKYGVCYRNDYSVLFYNEMQALSFPTKDEFYKSANIDGNLLKDIWDEVQDPRFM